MRRRHIAREAIKEGITPIEVMLKAMRELWDEGTPEAKREAARIAKDAAPYVHPRLASIDQTIHEPQRYVIRLPKPCLTTEEWEAQVKTGRFEAGEEPGAIDCLSADISETGVVQPSRHIISPQ